MSNHTPQQKPPTDQGWTAGTCMPSHDMSPTGRNQQMSELYYYVFPEDRPPFLSDLFVQVLPEPNPKYNYDGMED